MPALTKKEMRPIHRCVLESCALPRPGAEADSASQWAASPSSSTPASASLPRCARCGRSPNYGKTSPSTGMRGRSQAATVPIRRTGQFARPHRAAAGEQRLSHPAGNAGRGDEQERARAICAAAGVERGAGPAAAVGPAVVIAPAADRGLRDRPAEYGDIFDGSTESRARSRS